MGISDTICGGSQEQRWVFAGIIGGMLMAIKFQGWPTNRGGWSQACPAASAGTKLSGIFFSGPQTCLVRCACWWLVCGLVGVVAVFFVVVLEVIFNLHMKGRRRRKERWRKEGLRRRSCRWTVTISGEMAQVLHHRPDHLVFFHSTHLFKLALLYTNS